MGNPWAPPDENAPPQGGAPAQGSQTPGGSVPPGQAPAGPPSPPDPWVGAGLPTERPRTPADPPDPAGVARAYRACTWGAGLLLLGLLTVTAPYPLLLLAPVAALAAFVVAIVAVVRAVRARGRGTVVVMSSALVVGSMLWSMSSLDSVVFLDELREYQSCSSVALTQQAERACWATYEQARLDRVEQMRPATP